ncbi:DUF308 domain-containing protein [Flavihumibacter rivuli]|uniref:HdeD family acid-resistance protein n=1 Tax=Flavihumibacter rivuli TaxID=2838156 RepID=UPI001BDEA69C|nr:DUF308 domain-containing protein [Flavihumibacter rivuli]ULQ57180.1 DUF308 domain-containing protein [Flavihumibacter rivuli]
MQTILRKWWVILIQGILMILLSFYIFNNPGVVLTGISLWISILVLGAGIAGLVAWLVSEKEDRDTGALLWSIATILFGILMLGNLFITMKTVTLFFGAWMAMTGWMLASTGWELRSVSNSGWALLIIGVLSLIAGIMMFFNMGMAATGISTILGLQVLMAGIGMIILAFIKKSVVKTVKERIGNIQEGLK